MVAEGYNYWETPLENWLSYTLNLIYKKGGKPQLLTEYQKEKEQNANELLQTLENLNKTETWQ